MKIVQPLDSFFIIKTESEKSTHSPLYLSTCNSYDIKMEVIDLVTFTLRYKVHKIVLI